MIQSSVGDGSTKLKIQVFYKAEILLSVITVMTIYIATIMGCLKCLKRNIYVRGFVFKNTLFFTIF